jgi:hypothetical protein
MQDTFARYRGMVGELQWWFAFPRDCLPPLVEWVSRQSGSPTHTLPSPAFCLVFRKCLVRCRGPACLSLTRRSSVSVEAWPFC